MTSVIKVSSIQTVAGTGDSGFSGDGGAAVAANLNEPKAVTLDRRGNLIIADSENHVVRKVDRMSGRIATLAGLADMTHATIDMVPSGLGAIPEVEDLLGEARATSDPVFAQQADLSGTVRYVVKGTGEMKRFGGDGGPADQALLNFPSAVVVDRSGHVYIADTMNHRIRRVEAGTGRITTIAGTGQPRFGGDGGPAVSASLHEPVALAVSETGTLYVADQSNNRVRAIDLATGHIRTVAGTGSAGYNGDGIPAGEAALAGPSGLALAEDGTLFIADTFNGRIRAVDPTTGLIRTAVGDGDTYRYQGADEPPSPSISRPTGIALDLQKGDLIMTDSDNHLVRRWDRATGRIERLAGVGAAQYGGDGGPALDASLNYPFGVAIDGDGHLFIADTFNHRVRELVP